MNVKWMAHIRVVNQYPLLSILSKREVAYNVLITLIVGSLSIYNRRLGLGTAIG